MVAQDFNLVFVRQRQANLCKFQPSKVYTVRPCLKKLKTYNTIKYKKIKIHDF